MKILKKYIVLLIVLCSFNAFADVGGSSYEHPESCKQVVEAGKQLAIDDTSGFSAQTTLQDFVACNLEVLPTSLSTEIMYSMFGDAILSPLSQVNGFVKSIYTKGDQISVDDIDVIEMSAYLQDKVKTFPVIIAAVEALTFASFQLISFMLAGFSLFYLVNTMSEGTYLGKQVNTFWTFAKMGGVMALIFPLDGVGLNGVQLIILFIAFCGSLLASLIWAILPLFKYAYLNEFTSVDTDLKVEKNSKTLEMSESLITSSLCDITARQALLLKGIAVKDFTEDVLSTNKMFTCLKETTTQLDFDHPFEHRKTMNCAQVEGVEHYVDCGKVNYGPTNDEVLKLKIRTEIYDKAREIAKKTIASNCTVNSDLKKGDESRYYTYCSDIDALEFTTDFKGETILGLISGGEYTDDDYKADLLILKSKLDSALETNLSTAILSNTDLEEELEEKISFALNKGWFNAGTFLFDIGSSTQVKNIEYEAVMNKLDYETPYPSDVLKETIENNPANQSSSAAAAYDIHLKDLYNRSAIKGDVKAMSSKDNIATIFTLSNDIKGIKLQEKYDDYKVIKSNLINEMSDDAEEKELGAINSLLFPTLLLGQEFNEPDLGADNTCAEDYSNCKKMPINPIATIIDTSRSSASSTGIMIMVGNFMSLGLKAISNESEKRASIKEYDLAKSGLMMGVNVASLLIDFALMFLNFNIIISLLAGYILPVVLFVYFVGNALSWILSLIVAVSGATLWLGLHLMPSKDEGFAGHAKKGYLMIMDVLLKPVFLVLGVFGAFLLSTILVVVFNATFEVVMSTFAFFDAPKSMIELFYNFLLNIIYVIFLIIIFFKSAKAVYKIPNALENWIGLMAYEDASMWKEVTGLIEKTFMSGIKKFLIFS